MIGFGFKASASSKSNYYSYVFHMWGLNAITAIDNSVDKSAYLITLSSEFNNQTFELHTKNIIICDSPFKYSGIFYCDSEGVSVYYGSIVNTGLHTYVGQVKTRWGDTYVIPESFLYTPTKRDDIEAFIRTLSRFSNNVENSVSNTPSVDTVAQLTHPSLFEISVYALSTLFLVSVLFKPLKKLIKSKENSLNKKNLISIYRGVGNFSSKNRWLLVYIFLGMFLFLVPILIGLSYKDRGTFDLGYISRFFIDSLNVKVFSQPQGTFRFLMFYYLSALICVVFLLVAPNLVEIIFLSTNKLINHKLRKSFIKYPIPTLIFIGFVCAIFFDVKMVYTLLYLSLFSISYILYLAFKNKANNIKYSVRERIALLAIFTLTLVLGVGYRHYYSLENAGFKPEPLIDIGDKYAFFPYSKDYGKNALFQKYIIKPEYPLFLDYYLIYHPKFSKIQNKNISDFENTGNFIILNSGLRDTSEFLVNNFELLSNFNQTLSMNFGVENFDFSLGSKYSIKIYFNCTKALPTENIYIKLFYDSYENDVTKVEKPLVYFPGCDATIRSVSYTLPVEIGFTGHGNVIINIYEIYGLVPSYIKSISFYKDGLLIPVKYFTYNKDEKIFLRNINSGDTVTNYSFTDISDKTFENKLDSEFDLSEKANGLVKEKLLRNPFLIWFDFDKPVMVEKSEN